MDEKSTSFSIADSSSEELQAQITALVQQNTQREARLAQEYNAGLDPLTYFHMRLNAMTQLLLDEHGQLKLEFLTQSILSHLLDTALASAQKNKEEQESAQARSKLLDGIPEALQQGLFHG
jgi:hypothetical protein